MRRRQRDSRRGGAGGRATGRTLEGISRHWLLRLDLRGHVALSELVELLGEALHPTFRVAART
ncbi:MAG: hypothetical protein M3302_09810, partial [Actinomycetota bacterium]|nr:hypothetical protein [Actinomycetota bacterium]